MAEAYRRAEKPEDTLPSNEIRVRRGVGIGRYLKRAWELLNNTEGGDDTVVIKGVSNAVQSAVDLAELIKHRVKGLHQINKISNITIVDEYEPLIEGLDHLKFSRIVTMLQITLSKNVTSADKNEIGYQEPIPESEVQEYNEKERLDDGRRNQRKSRGNGEGRGRGRGRRGGRGGRRAGGDRVRDSDDKRDERDTNRGEGTRRGGRNQRSGKQQDNRDNNDEGARP